MKRILVTLVICLFLVATATLAQVSTASLTGLVTDQSGAAVPNVTVTVTLKSTNTERSTMTDQMGYYTFPSVPIGDYLITADLSGFNRTAREFNLQTGQRARVDLTIEVGTEKTTVNVEAVVPQLSTQDASVGAVIDNNFVTQFPLLLRGWDDLTILVAGVQGLRQTDQAGAANSSRAGQFNVHGVRSLQNNFLLDGLDNNSISENVQELSTQVVRPSIDAIQEFTMRFRSSRSLPTHTRPNWAANLDPPSASPPRGGPTSFMASSTSTCETAFSTRLISSPIATA